MSYEPCVTLASYVVLLNQQSRFAPKVIGQMTVERKNGSDSDSDYKDAVRGEVAVFSAGNSPGRKRTAFYCFINQRGALGGEAMLLCQRAVKPSVRAIRRSKISGKLDSTATPTAESLGYKTITSFFDSINLGSKPAAAMAHFGRL